MHIDPNTINPYIRVAMPSTLPAGHAIRRRVILDYELIYIEAGSCHIRYRDTDCLCRTGDFVLLHPGVPHSFLPLEQDLSQPHIHFDPVYSADSHERFISFVDQDGLSKAELRLIHGELFGDTQSPLITFADKDAALSLFYGIVRDANRSPLLRKARLTALLDRMIADNFASCLKKEHPSYSIARRIKDYIDAGQGLAAPLDHFEKLFSYSKFYLEQQFKQAYGISLIAYRNDRRFQAAKALLQTQSVSKVAEQLGFSSIYAFSRAFKQHFQLSPSQYKKQQTDT